MKTTHLFISKFLLILLFVPILISCSKDEEEEPENNVPLVTLGVINTSSGGGSYIDGVWNNDISCYGTIKSNGGGAITECGFCWSTNADDIPDIKNGEKHVMSASDIVDGKFSFKLPVPLYKSYKVRAYAINSFGIGYSEVGFARGGSISPR